MQDKLTFSAAWKGQPMVAQEVVDAMREFLVGLARVSPWGPPFDATGSTYRQAHMPIAEDLSDFDEVALKAMDNKEVRFFSASEPGTMRIRPDSRTVFGMDATFSDYPQKKLKKHAVTISIGLGSSDGSCGGGVGIGVPFYTPFTEENGKWGVGKQPLAVFDYLMGFFDPFCCAVYSTEFLDSIRAKWGEGDDGLLLGWMSYTRNPKVRAALAGDPRARDYRGGILLELGDSVDAFDDPAVRNVAIEIRDKLRAAGATDWMEGADGHTARF